MAAQLQHWIVTCTTCGSPAEHHCNTCGDILCLRCKEIHEKSNATKHHRIVHYTERVIPSELQGQCGDHPDHGYLFWCETCAKAVCSECVTNGTHKSHALCKISCKVEEQRTRIKEDFDRNSSLLAQWKKSLQNLHKEIGDFEKSYNELDREISRQADEICNYVRRTEVKRRKQLQNMKTIKADAFQEHEKMLEEGIKNTKKQIKEVEEKLRSDNIEVFLHYANKKDNRVVRPRENHPQLPIFKSGELDEEIIEKLFGNLVLEELDKSSHGNTMSRRWSSESLNKGEGMRSKTATGPDIKFHDDKMTVISLLPLATIEATIQTSTSHGAPAIACTNSGLVWARTADWTIQMMDRRGNVETTINLDFDMIRMTVTQQGAIIATDCSNKCITNVSKEGTRKTFTVEWKPFGICYLLDGDLMVTFRDAGRVIQYNSSGKVVRDLDKSHFSNPKSVAQNKINQHIYVLDESVLAFHLDGTLQYKYTGSDGNGIEPKGVCTDQAGHVFITDWRNHRVHVLDQDGNFLQYILTKDQGLYRPFSISIDSDGYVWIGEWERRTFCTCKRHSQLRICKYTS